MGHNLPYQTHTFSLVRACWSCICRSIEKFVRLRRSTRVTEFENDNLENLIVFVVVFLLTFLY